MKNKNVGHQIVSNYRPITCLPTIWKLLTSIITEYIYDHMAILHEQKGCKQNARGTKDQFLIDKLIMKTAKNRVVWIDYKKAYDSVPHSWIWKTLKMYGIANNIINFLELVMNIWKTDLTTQSHSLGTVNFLQGIFQSDSLSPMLFIICLLPLTTLLKKSGLGFTIHNVTISHLLYMDDLKLYAKSDKDILALTKIVKTFSNDICMWFGLDKCAIVTINRGQVLRGDSLKLPPDEVIDPLPLKESYKYLGILEHGSINNIDVKKKATMEYKKRLRQFLKSKLSGSNLLQAINTYTIPVMSYIAGIVDWTLDEMKQLDRMTRRQLTIHGALHKTDVDRLYVPRRKGGRGLKSIDDLVFKEWCALSEYLKHSTTLALKLVSKEKIVVKGMRENQTDHEDHFMKWEAKALHGKWAKLLKIVDEDYSKWLRTAHLKPPTEALIIAAQDQALHTNWLGHYILKTGETTDKCRRCKKFAETVMHIVSGCPML
uniref:Reverse transcriptase domain-containing protein n=1 Tax=Latimeria chalumnae TaxID=7897 RepID=H2ZVK0_LATCH